MIFLFVDGNAVDVDYVDYCACCTSQLSALPPKTLDNDDVAQVQTDQIKLKRLQPVVV
jgi:hypothetical protein